MSLPWIPRLKYGPQIINLSLPQKPWNLSPVGVGGYRVSAAGVPNSYQLRRDQRAEVEIRVTDDELSDVFAWIAYAQSPPFVVQFQFDQGVPSTSYNVYLDSPAMGEDVMITREDTINVVSLTIRTTSGTPFSVKYHDS